MANKALQSCVESNCTVAYYVMIKHQQRLNKARSKMTSFIQIGCKAKQSHKRHKYVTDEIQTASETK